jgi:hypothetical protein
LLKLPLLLPLGCVGAPHLRAQRCLGLLGFWFGRGREG